MPRACRRLGGRERAPIRKMNGQTMLNRSAPAGAAGRDRHRGLHRHRRGREHVGHRRGAWSRCSSRNPKVLLQAGVQQAHEVPVSFPKQRGGAKVVVAEELQSANETVAGGEPSELQGRMTWSSRSARTKMFWRGMEVAVWDSGFPVFIVTGSRWLETRALGY